MQMTLTVKFDKTEWDEFRRPISGNGGGQIFIRRCQGQLNFKDKSLTLEGDDVDRWFKYRDNYGAGGFQQRLGRAS